MMGIKIKRLHHLTVNAPSGEQEKVRWFYGTILGLKEIPIPKKLEGVYEIIWYELTDVLLHIEFTKNYIQPREQYENDVIMPGRHFALEVEKLSEIRAKFEKHQVVIREAVSLTDRDRFYAVDPFGNFIELIEFKAYT